MEFRYSVCCKPTARQPIGPAQSIMRAAPGSSRVPSARGSARMPRPPRRRALEGGCPHTASRLARLALLGLISAVGDRLPGSDHGAAEIRLAGKAHGDGAAVTVLLARPAAKLAALGKGFQEARRRASAGPRVAGAHAGLPELRRIDAVEPDFDAGDADA